MFFYTYLLRCTNQAYYCGHTDNLDRRLQQHHDGLIGYTAKLKPVELVWQGVFLTRAEAIDFELKVKGWTRAKKEALIVGDWDRIKTLSKSKSGAITSAVRPVPCDHSQDLPADRLVRANVASVENQASTSISTWRTVESDELLACVYRGLR